MKTLFVANGVVVGQGSVHAPGAVISGPDGATAYNVEDASPASVGWTVTLANGVPTFAAPPVLLPILTPPQFKLLYTSAERVAIRSKRATDPILDDFFQLVDDPRLTEVDRNLANVQDGVTYSLSVTRAMLTPPYSDTDIATRRAAILS